MHRDDFKKTLLVLPSGSKPAFLPVYDWAVSTGVGIRRDGICGNSNGNETIRCAGKMAAVFEFFGNYELMKKLGWWDGIKDKSGNGYRLDECVERGMPTYCDLSRGGTSGLNLMKSEPVLINELTNRIGYHFVLMEVKYPKVIFRGKTVAVSVTWENRGVAPIFIPVKAAFALLASDGRVIQVCDASTSIPSSWKSDTPLTLEDKIVFKNAKKGDYLLAVGILRPNDGLRPSIKLGIDQKSYNGWYELGPVKVR